MGSLHSRYEGVVFEETMLVKVRGFIDDAKRKSFFTFCTNACIY